MKKKSASFLTLILSIVSATSDAVGDEDTPIRLNLPVNTDNAQSILLCGVKDGAVLSVAKEAAEITTGCFELTKDDLDGGLFFTPPNHFSGDITLSLIVNATESVDLTVTVNPVVDTPIIGFGPVVDEDTSIPIRGIQSRLMDQDGSETLTIELCNIINGAVLSAGQPTTPGCYDVTEVLEGLTVTPPLHYSGSFLINVAATATEKSSGETATASASCGLLVTVRPIANKPPLVVSDASYMIPTTQCYNFKQYPAGTILEATHADAVPFAGGDVELVLNPEGSAHTTIGVIKEGEEPFAYLAGENGTMPNHCTPAGLGLFDLDEATWGKPLTDKKASKYRARLNSMVKTLTFTFIPNSSKPIIYFELVFGDLGDWNTYKFDVDSASFRMDAFDGNSPSNLIASHELEPLIELGDDGNDACLHKAVLRVEVPQGSSCDKSSTAACIKEVVVSFNGTIDGTHTDQIWDPHFAISEVCFPGAQEPFIIVPLDIESDLVDTDGSERFVLSISGIPEGFTLGYGDVSTAAVVPVSPPTDGRYILLAAWKYVGQRAFFPLQCELESSTIEPQRSRAISVTCCDDNSTGSRPGCLANVNFPTAKAHCEANALRLCTVAEIQSGSGAGTGCKFDVSSVWTSDTCGVVTATLAQVSEGLALLGPQDSTGAFSIAVTATTIDGASVARVTRTLNVNVYKESEQAVTKAKSLVLENLVLTFGSSGHREATVSILYGLCVFSLILVLVDL